MKKYKSEALEALHETVSGLHKIGLITDDEAHWYDNGCLAKPAAPVSRHAPRTVTEKPAARLAVSV